MEKRDITKENILNFIQECGNDVSFVELRKTFNNFEGDFSFTVTNKNLVLWDGVSAELISTLKELLNNKEIELAPTHPVVYLIDGLLPTMPVAKQFRTYKEPRWLPVVLRAHNSK